MRRGRSVLFFSVLVIGTAWVALTLGRPAPSQNPVRSIHNSGPLGLRGLWLFLQESGVAVQAVETSLTELPPRLDTLVIAAPSVQPLTTSERDALDAWVQKGGRLIYLPEAPLGDDNVLNEWLDLESSTELRGEWVPGLSAGISIPVNAGFLRDPARRWTLVVARTLGVRAPDATPVATGNSGERLALRKRWGQGDVWIFANTSVFENRWLGQGNNLDLAWALMSRGQVGFDEWHHSGEGAPPAFSWGLLLFVFQCVALGGGVTWTFGTRMGPVPQPRPVEKQRSILEYVHTLAWMFRKHRVESDLLREAGLRVRRLAHERAFVPRDATVEQLAQWLPTRTGIDASEIRSLFLAIEDLSKPGAAPVTPRVFWTVDQRVARLERVLRGQARHR